MNVLPQDDDRGQVGIGTLIIFIALVLVAAVAAGVLVNTAGLLQAQAEDTGSDAQSEVSNQIDVVSATGTVSNSNVSEVNLVVKKSPGSDPIDLNEATIQYTSGTAATTLENASGGTADGSSFVASEVKGNGNVVLDNTGERWEVTVDVSSVESNSAGLGEGSSATFRIVDQSGATTIYGVNVPDTLGSDNYVMV